MTADRVSVRTMEESDLDEADRICRAAFDHFIGVDNVFGDAQYVVPRWRAAPDQALVATVDGELVGSNILTRWGSVGVFGPLSVHPDRWDEGIAKALMGPTVELLDGWGTTHQGLFTFATSAKHIGLYQRFGFWPAYLTAVMSKPVAPDADAGWTVRLSTAGDHDALVDACRSATDRVYAGLDLTAEIDAVAAQGLGDTVVLIDGDDVRGPAVCHAGGPSEAHGDQLYVKCGAVAPGAGAEQSFERLVDGCEALAADLGCETIGLGVNTGRVRAYQVLLDRGFVVGMYGIAMQRGDPHGYNRPDAYVIDDWR